ncbi:MAG: DUF1800 domain-containing protein [Granulosicoccaceae bacterium]
MSKKTWARSLICTVITTLLATTAACSGGGSNSSNPDINAGPTVTGEINPGIIEYNIPATTPENAAQLLSRATFGTTHAAIDAVMQDGIALWVEKQFTLKGPAHLDYVRQYSNGSLRSPRHDYWWVQATLGKDQLRQRMAFALSEIMVISDIGYSLSNSQYGVTRYYDKLLENSFGNYRDLLEEVTLSPVMGLYLSMLQNARGDPETNTRADENFAREVMQLFSIGLHELENDGTVKTLNGKPIPAYTQTDVENYARVFTGWNYFNPRAWNQTLNTGGDLISNMAPVEEYHDVDSKTLIDGQQTPAGVTAEEDLKVALDSLANHPNVGPFIGKQLIQKLVTSNPSPAYVGRVATAFNNNGEGVRGDLTAVLRAILFDEEAFSGSTSQPNFGKLREPIMRLTHLWRAFNVQPGTDAINGAFNTGSPALVGIDSVIGQGPLLATSVFNFYRPDFTPQGPTYRANVLVPEAEIYTDNNILATTSRVNAQIQRFYLQNPDTVQRRWSHIDLSRELALVDKPEELLDELNVLLMSGSMGDPMRAALIDHMALFGDTDEDRSRAVRDVISLIVASPDYLVQM